ncbi:MAG: TatD family hydrolase [Candidatus Paceibacterota bacterium]|jgi:TatD DNase family protein
MTPIKTANIFSIDAHTHVQFPEFDDDRVAVMSRAREAGVGMINAGADVESSKKAIALARQYPGWAWAVIGIHPTELKDMPLFATITELVRDPLVVGIGECGLDYFHQNDTDARTAQKELFLSHIALSREIKKPLVIHCREAFPDVRDILRTQRNELLLNPGVLHFFTGTIDDARALLDLNFSFTFGGLVTFNRSFDEVLKFIPRDHLLVETDAPFVAPIPYRGKRNEPAYVEEVIQVLARVLSIDRAMFGKTLLETTRRIFHLGA